MHRFHILAAAGALLFPLAAANGQALQRPVRTSAVAVEVPQVLARAMAIGRPDPNMTLHLSISLTLADPAGLESFVDSVSDPRSPNYRHFVTPQEVGSRFGMSAAKVKAVADYLKSQGIQVQLVGDNRMSILADATVAQAEKAFHTRINNYLETGAAKLVSTPFFSFSTVPQVPANLAPSILDIEGLESYTRPKYRALTPTQTRVLYGLAPIYDGGMRGEGRTVAISNWDGYRLSNVPLYYSRFGLPTPAGGVNSNVHVVTISGGAGSGAAGAEGDLDIQMVLGMAPLSNFYIYDGGASDLIGVLTREANDNLADVISESYGWNLPAATATAAHNLHLSMSAQGITYMAASGDSGTTIEPYSYPNYDPEVLQVGGTTATVDAAGNRTGEVGWSGSGGGWSTNAAAFNTRPSWQVGNGVPTNVNFRLGPDVALHAASSTGAYQFYFNGSLSSAYNGTSFACPVFAGSLAVAEQKIISLGGLPPDANGKQRFGRIQDLFYAQNGRADIWKDITSGSNGRLPNGATSNATPGWDFVTGWGAINFNAFAASQTSTTPDFTVSASPSSQTVVQGAGTSYTVTVSAINGFSGTEDLTVSGLPAGASASLTPSSLVGSGSSTLGVSTSTSTAPGTYPLTLTVTSGTITHTATVSLIVTTPVPPDFAISASPSSRTISRGASTTYAVAVAGQAGFTGNVALSVTGAPGTATFSPVSVTGTGSSTLTVKTTASTQRKTYTLTITGTSGTVSHTTQVTLTVTR